MSKLEEHVLFGLTGDKLGVVFRRVHASYDKHYATKRVHQFVRPTIRDADLNNRVTLLGLRKQSRLGIHLQIIRRHLEWNDCVTCRHFIHIALIEGIDVVERFLSFLMYWNVEWVLCKLNRTRRIDVSVVEESHESRQVALVELTFANLDCIHHLGFRIAHDFPDLGCLEVGKSCKHIILLDLGGSHSNEVRLSSTHIEVRLKSINSKTGNSSCISSSEDIDDKLTVCVVFVPITRLKTNHFTI